MKITEYRKTLFITLVPLMLSVHTISCSREKNRITHKKTTNIKGQDAKQLNVIIKENNCSVKKMSKKCLTLIEAEANKGVLRAQGILGYHYSYVPHKNIKKAIKWYRLAAEQGNVFAQVSLALIFSDDKTKDLKQSLKWWLLAHKNGDKEAAYMIGSAYYKGYGTPINYEKALEWYEVSAKNGDADAQKMLGGMYLTGKGVDKNFNIARSWLTRSIKNGSKDAVKMLEALDSLDNSKKLAPKEINRTTKSLLTYFQNICLENINNHRKIDIAAKVLKWRETTDKDDLLMLNADKMWIVSKAKEKILIGYKKGGGCSVSSIKANADNLIKKFKSLFKAKLLTKETKGYQTMQIFEFSYFGIELVAMITHELNGNNGAITIGAMPRKIYVKEQMPKNEGQAYD